MKYIYLIKRSSAYIIDYFICGMINRFLSSIFLIHSTFLANISKFNDSQYLTNLNNSELRLFASDLLESSTTYILFTLLIYILYYVIFTKLLKSRTIGCLLNGLLISTNNNRANYSSLSLRMLLNNGGILLLAISIVLIVFDSNSAISIGIILSSLIYFIFLLINIVYLFTTSNSIVDRLSNTKPMMIIKQI